MPTLNLLLVAVLFSLIPGQLVRIPLFSQTGAITLSDLLVFAFDLSFIFYALFKSKKIDLPPKITVPATLFILSAAASTILAGVKLTAGEVMVSSTFLLRFVIYFVFFVAAFNILKKRLAANWVSLLLIISAIFAGLGLFQFFAFSDLSNLAYYGWDPHQRRVVSTLLDPNFSGMVLTIFASYALANYVFLKKNLYLVLFAFLFLVEILTFSRSSYLAFLVMLSVIGFLKSPKVLLVSYLVFFIAFLAVPQMRARVIGAFTVDETARARIESWENAATIFKDQPVLGIGFNTYRYTQAKYGFFSSDNPLGGHSGAGVDSSILLVAATTGLVGLIFYLSMIFIMVKAFAKRASKNPYALAALASVLGLIIHSQFVNSLFFPQILMLVWFSTALAIKNDN